MKENQDKEIRSVNFVEKFISYLKKLLTNDLFIFEGSTNKFKKSFLSFLKDICHTSLPKEYCQTFYETYLIDLFLRPELFKSAKKQQEYWENLSFEAKEMWKILYKSIIN
ncbi:MAG: hypothetical protein ACFFAN_21165 [Promethearchaeota archaeon]